MNKNQQESPVADVVDLPSVAAALVPRALVRRWSSADILLGICPTHALQLSVVPITNKCVVLSLFNWTTATSRCLLFVLLCVISTL